MKKSISLFALSFVFVLLLSPVMVSAATTFVGQGPTSLDAVANIIETVGSWFQGIVFTIAIIMIVWAGLTWMTAGGSDDKLKEARSRLIWGLVGLAVALFAGVAQTFIQSII